MDLCARTGSKNYNRISNVLLDRFFPKDTDLGINASKPDRREKNRAAAQRSRRKQMAKADKLHQEHEQLERENDTLCKEIQSLQQELKQLTWALKEHEMICVLRCPDFCLDLLQNPLWPEEVLGLKGK
uniref:Basic leucine zipper transcriptional factor ATF-like 2 n=1 Tax=Geotrypetes seraphini TaxID=260995 RepID=A0A6P8RYS8_GEOSA|nr:basic leucine zipper transcriptional factor ATF-like 2 [Geotrypetes seraphini]